MIDIKQGVSSPNPEKRNKERSLFTGEVLCEVVGINPTPEEYEKIYGYKPNWELNYKDIERKNGTFSLVEFHLRFDPNDQISGKDYDPVVASLPIYISKEYVTNKAGDKIQVIDDHNQSAWIEQVPGKTPAEMMQMYIEKIEAGPGKERYAEYLKQFDLKTLRHAKKGEVELYDFLFTCTRYKRHNYSPRGEEDVMIPLNNFVLEGDPEKASEAFDKVVDGDTSFIKMLLKSGACRHDDGSRVKVGAIARVRIDDNNPMRPRFYQAFYTSPLDVFVFQDVTVPRERIHEDKQYLTRLNPNRFKLFMNDTYISPLEWGGTFKLQEFNRDDYKAPANQVSDSASDDLPGLGGGDDLPF